METVKQRDGRKVVAAAMQWHGIIGALYKQL